jgi:SAM-dependent methyltransferase
MRIEPRYGRFYPKGILENVDGVFRGDMRPARLIGQDETHLTFDFNHPLSRYPARLEVEIGEVHPAPDEHGGRCNDILETLLKGPGMQVRTDRDRPTDFFSDAPFQRMDPSDDALFYTMPRMLNHLDTVAQSQVRALYRRLLRPGSEILDLMSSFNSHLPDELLPARVTGLGMNNEELEANAVLSKRLVHDLNRDPGLPFGEARFDAVICNLSVEYLTDPFAVFREVARVLRPGGLFVLPFSNRWFPPKVINLWHNLHEFERAGLVLEYFLASEAFEGLESLSVRGLTRPEDDLHIQASPFSDPIHAVWGRRRAR